MPFVEIIWKEEKMPKEEMLKLRSLVKQIVSKNLIKIDPEHRVEESMIDLRIIKAGEYDQIGPDLYITILMRYVEVRDRYKQNLIIEITKDIMESGQISIPKDTLIEIVITNRVSNYDYNSNNKPKS